MRIAGSRARHSAIDRTERHINAIVAHAGGLADYRLFGFWRPKEYITDELRRLETIRMIDRLAAELEAGGATEIDDALLAAAYVKTANQETLPQILRGVAA